MSRDGAQHEMGSRRDRNGRKEKAKSVRATGYAPGNTLETPRLEGRPLPCQILYPPLSTGKPTPDYLQAYFQVENTTQAFD